MHKVIYEFTLIYKSLVFVIWFIWRIWVWIKYEKSILLQLTSVFWNILYNFLNFIPLDFLVVGDKLLQIKFEIILYLEQFFWFNWLIVRIRGSFSLFFGENSKLEIMLLLLQFIKFFFNLCCEMNLFCHLLLNEFFLWLMLNIFNFKMLNLIIFILYQFI